MFLLGLLIVGNELGGFEINSNNGLIRVRDGEVVDYELQTEFVLTVSGRGLGAEDGVLNVAYATVIAKVTNTNDNPPRFSQESYAIDVEEGIARESVVLKVEAFDPDTGLDGFVFEIIDGNVDGAFTMKTAQPGVIFTNTVLDREIRDSYRLTVGARDSGLSSSEPPLTGTATVDIRVLDANDSPLQLPRALPPVRVSKAVPGSHVATVRANDIDGDAAAAASYSVANNSDVFSVEKFTGRVYLKAPIVSDQQVEIHATDGEF